MLILARRNGEMIRIGDDTTIIIYKGNNGHIKVGIDAPRHIPVHREEIYQRIQKEKHSQKDSA